MVICHYQFNHYEKKNIYLPVGFIDAEVHIGTFPSGIYVVTVKGNGVNLKKTIAILKK